MALRLTYEDSRGDTAIKPWALPMIVAAICVPIIAAFGSSSNGPAIGLAIGALVAVTLVVWAVRSKPFAKLEVAEHTDDERRVLVLAAGEIHGAEAQRVAELSAGAADVRILVPAPTRKLERWLSAEDRAREAAQDTLARSAGALTATGLHVSGSVGDSSPLQALADELRSYPADEVIVISDDRARVENLRNDLAIPLTRVSPG
jgi:hypothetical protein